MDPPPRPKKKENEDLSQLSGLHEIFAGVYFWGMAIFLRFAGTNLCDWDRVVFLAGN